MAIASDRLKKFLNEPPAVYTSERVVLPDGVKPAAVHVKCETITSSTSSKNQTEEEKQKKRKQEKMIKKKNLSASLKSRLWAETDRHDNYEMFPFYKNELKEDFFFSSSYLLFYFYFFPISLDR